MNTRYGWRSIRMSTTYPEFFLTQLRAIFRAAVHGDVHLLFPMVSTLEEVRHIKKLVRETREQLAREGATFVDQLPLGVMMEVPAAAICIDSILAEVDSLSIGSNDLIQYTLAADRTNEKVSHLYEPTHPAILKFIKMTVDAAHQHGIWTGVCGEIGGDAVLVPLLIGLGVDELSCAPAVIPEVKYMIRRIRLDEARALAEFALQSESPSEIYTRCVELARASAPSLFENKA